MTSRTQNKRALAAESRGALVDLSAQTDQMAGVVGGLSDRTSEVLTGLLFGVPGCVLGLSLAMHYVVALAILGAAGGLAFGGSLGILIYRALDGRRRKVLAIHVALSASAENIRQLKEMHADPYLLKEAEDNHGRLQLNLLTAVGAPHDPSPSASAAAPQTPQLPAAQPAPQTPQLPAAQPAPQTPQLPAAQPAPQAPQPVGSRGRRSRT